MPSRLCLLAVICCAFSTALTAPAKISSRELQLNQPYKKWSAAQKRAKSLGLHTNLEDHLAANPSLKPRLLLDTPYGQQMVKENLTKQARDPEYKNVESISFPVLACDEALGIEILQENLKKPLPAESSATEVYKALLQQINQQHPDLDTFKSSIEQSASLGHIFSRTCNSYYPVHSVREKSQQLLLKAICQSGLGSTDYSDIAAVNKLAQMSADDNMGLIGGVVSVALKLNSNAAFGFLTKQSKANVATLKSFFKTLKITSLKDEFTQDLKYEYVLQLEGVSALIDNNPYPKSSFDPENIDATLRSLDELQLLSARNALAHFTIKTTFDTSKSPITSHNPSTNPDYAALIATSSYSPSNKTVLSKFLKGYSFYLENLAQASLNLDIQHLEIACQLHYLEHGNYPASLDQLIPSYLPAPIKNCYTQRAYSYTSTTTEYPTISGSIPLPEKKTISHSIELLSQP